jgi:outer membrane protein assembly factor BamB
MRTPACIIAIVLGVQFACAGDWPMWRYDASRGASSPHAIPIDLDLHWVRQCPESMPAWPETQYKLRFDKAPQPVVMGEQMFIPSNRNDWIMAINTRTGEENWRFYADGPVRFAPVAADGKVFFCSDDGFLYCLDAGTGKELWRVSGGPSRRLLLGNMRLVSSWPARGGPVLDNGKLYFAASIWPFMGIFIHAVDPNTGKIVWTNSGDGTNWVIQPHGAPSFGAVVPQGHLAASGDYLIVPGGRSTPGVFDANTGELLSFSYDKRAGGHEVMASAQCYYNGDKTFFLADGALAEGKPPVLFDRKTAVADESGVIKLMAGTGDVTEDTVKDRRGKTRKVQKLTRKELSEAKADQNGRWKIRAGGFLFSVDDRMVAMFDENVGGEAVWRVELPKTVWELIAADDRLFVVTEDAKVYCFGSGEREPIHHGLDLRRPLAAQAAATKAQQLLRAGGARDGYALALGISDGELITAVILQSKMHVVAVDPDPAKVARLRNRLVAAGLHGSRCSVIQADLNETLLPQYLCHLVFSEQSDPDLLKGNGAAQQVFRSLRPYGGRAVLGLSNKAHAAFAEKAAAATLPKADLQRHDGVTILTREGALPDTSNWTHQYADAAQTLVSQDRIIKAPMGVLWFGGVSHEGILPRHGHGPSPQVAGGRLVIEGPNMLRCVDVYTGRLIWQKEIVDLGKYYNRTDHFAGAGEIGSNYVTLPDRVYAVKGGTIMAIDAATGETARTIELGGEKGDSFGYLAVSGDYLVTTSSPVKIDLGKSKETGAPKVKIPANTIEIIPPNDKWTYLAGKDAADGWTKPGAKLDEWKTGRAGFGYGDGDDRTEIKMKGKFGRVYIRREFDAATVEKASELLLAINYDDGFIAYLNGVEVARKSVGSGRGAAAKSIRSHEASGTEIVAIDGFKKHIRPGANVLAIEGHNTSLGSSDFSLDPYLLAVGGEKTNVVAEPEKGLATVLEPTQYASGSRQLRVYDRHTGKLLWSRDAQANFRHNNIAVSTDRVFCVDNFSASKLRAIARRGVASDVQAKIYALDLATGDLKWEYSDKVFGTFLNYSAEHDILLQAGSAYRDRAKDEVSKGMTGLRGSTGEQLWATDEGYGGPCLLWQNRILTNGGSGHAIDIRNGKKTNWSWSRHYGCNTALGSQHLMTFRSGAAGFYDLSGDSGTGNLGGFRSSCTANLIPADGLLNAPDYTRTCKCAYQNQTSLALVHMPEAEFWTFGAKPTAGRIGINFAAPGDRRDANGTLWLEHPVVGGNSHKLDVKIEGDDVRNHRRHSSAIAGKTHLWVAASAVSGMKSITVKLPDFKGPHTVRLYVAATDSQESAFSVDVQGKTADISVGSTASVHPFPGVNLDGELTLTFTARKGHPVVSGIEVIAE